MYTSRIKWPSTGWEWYGQASDGSNLMRIKSVSVISRTINIDKSFQNSFCQINLENTDNYFTLKTAPGTDDEFLRSQPMEVYYNGTLIFSGKIRETPEPIDNTVFSVIADGLAAGFESEINRKIKASEFPNAPSQSLGKYGTIAYGNCTDADTDNTGLCKAVRIDSNKYKASFLKITSLGDCFKLNDDGTYTDISSDCTLNNDTGGMHSEINYAGTDIDEIYFNCQGAPYTIGNYTRSNSDTSSRSNDISLQESTWFIKFRSTDTTNEQGWLSWNGTGNYSGILVNGSAGISGVVLGATNYRSFEDIDEYIDGEWHIMRIYIAGSGQNDIDDCEMAIDDDGTGFNWNDIAEGVLGVNKTGSPDAWGDFVVGCNKYGCGNVEIDWVAGFAGDYRGKNANEILESVRSGDAEYFFDYYKGSGSTIYDLSGNSRNLTHSTSDSSNFWNTVSQITNYAEMLQNLNQNFGKFGLSNSDVSDVADIYDVRGYVGALILIDDEIQWDEFMQRWAESGDGVFFQKADGTMGIKVLNWGTETSVDSIHQIYAGGFTFWKDITEVINELRRMYNFHFQKKVFKNLPADVTASTNWEAQSDDMDLRYHTSDSVTLDIATRKIFIQKIPLIWYKFTVPAVKGLSYELGDSVTISNRRGYFPDSERLMQIYSLTYNPTGMIEVKGIDITEINGRMIILLADADPNIHELEDEEDPNCSVLL